MKADLWYASARLGRARLVVEGKNWVTVDKMGHPLHPTQVSVLAKFLLKLDTLNFYCLELPYFPHILQKKWMAHFTLGHLFYPTLPYTLKSFFLSHVVPISSLCHN